jgi:hypothetical protein
MTLEVVVLPVPSEADAGTRTPDPLLTIQSPGGAPEGRQSRWSSGVDQDHRLRGNSGHTARCGWIPDGFGPKSRSWGQGLAGLARVRAAPARLLRLATRLRFLSPSGHCDVAVVVLWWLDVVELRRASGRAPPAAVGRARRRPRVPTARGFVAVRVVTFSAGPSSVLGRRGELLSAGSRWTRTRGARRALPHLHDVIDGELWPDPACVRAEEVMLSDLVSVLLRELPRSPPRGRRPVPRRH